LNSNIAQKHTIGKLKKAYEAKTGVEVNFKNYVTSASDTTPMQDMNSLGDNIVVFTSHEVNVPSSTMTRTPLAPTNAQLHSSPAVRPNNHSIKPTNMVASPYRNGQSSSASLGLPSTHMGGVTRSRHSGSFQVKDELGQPQQPLGDSKSRQPWTNSGKVFSCSYQ